MATGNVDRNEMEALNHPIRRQIMRVALRRAEDEPVSPKEIAEIMGLPLSRIGYHVRQLHKAGVLKLEKLTPVRGSTQHFYAPDLREQWAYAALKASEATDEPI
jgi:DNA-binding transcriptional ArsR family regulator